MYKNLRILYIKNILLSHKSIESVIIKIRKDDVWGQSIDADVITGPQKYEHENKCTLQNDKMIGRCCSE